MLDAPTEDGDSPVEKYGMLDPAVRAAMFELEEEEDDQNLE